MIIKQRNLEKSLLIIPDNLLVLIFPYISPYLMWERWILWLKKKKNQDHLRTLGEALPATMEL